MRRKFTKAIAIACMAGTLLTGCSKVSTETVSTHADDVIMTIGTTDVTVGEAWILGNTITSQYKDIYGEDFTFEEDLESGEYVKDTVILDIIDHIKKTKLLAIYFTNEEMTLDNSDMLSLTDTLEIEVEQEDLQDILDMGISKDTYLDYFIDEYVSQLALSDIYDKAADSLTDEDFKSGQIQSIYISDMEEANECLQRALDGEDFFTLATSYMDEVSNDTLTSTFYKNSLNDSLNDIVLTMEQDEIYPEIIEATFGGYFIVKCVSPYSIITSLDERDEAFSAIMTNKFNEYLDSLLEELETENPVEIYYEVLDEIDLTGLDTAEATQ